MKTQKPLVFRKLYAGFGALIGMLLILMAAAFVSFGRMQEANRWSTHTYEVLEQTHAIAESLFNIDTGARGYALTNNTRFLQPFNKGKADFARHWHEAKRLTVDNPRQQERLQKLQEIYQQWQKVYLQPLLAAQREVTSAAERSQEAAIATEGKRYSDAMRALLSNINDTETRLLAERREQAAASQLWAEIVLLCGGTWTVLLAIGLSTLLVRNTRRLENTNEDLEQEIAKRRRVEETLREAARKNSQLSVAITNLNSGVIISDPNLPDNPLVYVNAAFTAITGYTADETIGRNCRFLQGPETDSKTVRELRESIAAQRPFQSVIRNYRKDGTPFWNGLTINPVFDNAGRLINFVGLQSDITERREAEERLRESEQRFRVLVSSVQDYAIFQLDPAGSIVSWNAGAQRITGYTAEEIIGQNVSRFYTPEDVERGHLQEELHMAATTGRYEEEALRVRKDGSLYWASVVITVLHDEAGQVSGFAKVTRDITQRKQADEALLQAKSEAEQAKVEADRANTAKSEFLSRMSHELRTPLNAILGFGQLLDMDELAPDQKQAVEHIVKGGRHLLDLINEVLDIARIEAGRMELSPEPVGVRDIVRESLDLVRPLATPRRIEIDEDGACGPSETRFVLADRQRLKQVLLNLLGNAMKYNRDGGRVRVESESATDHRLRIVVHDTGPGIAPEKMERLFVPFDRLGAEQTRIEGSGLGLALSQRLVEAMGGEIGVHSTLGAGSAFWIELPLVESPLERHQRADTTGHEPSPAQGGRQERSVLYIEDNLSNLKLIERILQRRPEIKLLSAMQGSIGLELAREHRPAMILLDLHLPDISGHEVLLRLRAEPATRHIPIVVLSADATPGQIARGLSSGANGYLTKPLDLNKFLEVIDKTMRKLDVNQ